MCIFSNGGNGCEKLKDILYFIYGHRGSDLQKNLMRFTKQDNK